MRVVAAGAMLALASAFAPAAAQDAKDYPNRAIHIVVPFPAPSAIIKQCASQCFRCTPARWPHWVAKKLAA